MRMWNFIKRGEGRGVSCFWKVVVVVVLVMGLEGEILWVSLLEGCDGWVLDL